MTLTEEKTYSIGGVGALELVRKYGTPLYVYDEGIMRSAVLPSLERIFRGGAQAYKLCHEGVEQRQCVEDYARVR